MDTIIGGLSMLAKQYAGSEDAFASSSTERISEEALIEPRTYRFVQRIFATSKDRSAGTETFRRFGMND
jgi:hypothetical protein